MAQQYRSKLYKDIRNNIKKDESPSAIQESIHLNKYLVRALEEQPAKVWVKDGYIIFEVENWFWPDGSKPATEKHK